MGAFNSPALDGVIAAIAAIGDIEPDDDASAYCGLDIQGLANSCCYENVVFLLLHGRLPDGGEFERFRAELSKHRELPGSLIDALRPVAHEAHPLDLLRTAVDFLGMVDPEARDVSGASLYRSSIRTIAKLPTVIAAGHRLARGLEPIGPISRLTHAQNFFYMLSGYGPDEDAAIALDKMLILYAEHESDLTCLAACVMASSSMDYYSAITASIGALKGRLQHGTHEHAMPMLRCIGEIDRAEEWLADALAGRRHITGFGQRNETVRARIMKELSKTLAEKIGDRRWHMLGERVEEVMFREKGLRHNPDFYAGPLLNMLGLPVELCTTIVAAGRIAGWSAHVIEQLDKDGPFQQRIRQRSQKNLADQQREKRNFSRNMPAA